MLVSNPCDANIKPDQRVTNEAETLAKKGYKVKLFAWDRETKSATKERQKGFIIERIKIKSEFGTGLKQLPAFIKFYFVLIYKLIKLKFDIVHCHDFDTLIPGFIVAKIKRKKIVFDSHDYYPAMVRDKELQKISRMIEIIQDFMAKRSDYIITVNPVLKKIFERINNKVEVVMNCKKNSEFEDRKIDDLIDKHKLNGKIVFTYIGALTHHRNLFGVMDLFKDKNEAVFLIGGDGILKTEVKEKAKKAKNVIFLGRVKEKDVPRYTLASDYIIAVYQSVLSNNDIAGPPNKLFEAISSGKPIITSKYGSTGSLVKSIGCGITVDPDDKNDIDDKIKKLIKGDIVSKNIILNSKKAQKIYNWEKESKKLIDVYSKI